MRAITEVALLRYHVLLAMLPFLARSAGPLGIDVGGANSVVATTRNGGVDVIVNEASRRQTPSLVGFDKQQRLIGQRATTQLTSNPENCVGEIKALLGLSLEKARQLEPKPLASLVDAKGASSSLSDLSHVAVRLRGTEQYFSATQLLAMLLFQLQRYAEDELGSSTPDCTIAVPLHFTAAKRRAVLDAAQIAGLRGARLISDGTAAALDFALGRQDLPADQDHNVAFVDIGYNGMQICVVAIRCNSLRLLSHAFAPGVGGAALDELVCQELNTEFKAKYGIDALQQTRSSARLRQASEKVRRVLSANEDGSVALDCLVGDIDVQGSIARARLEELAEALLVRVRSTCQRALKASGLEEGSLHAVEMIGGCSRTPAYEGAVRTALGVEISRTINSEECVARGAALYAAMHSKGVRTKPFEVDEGLLHSAKVHWRRQSNGKGSGSFVLDQGLSLPLTKRLTVEAKAPLHVALRVEGAAADEMACVVTPRRRGKHNVYIEVQIDQNQMPTITAYDLQQEPTSSESTSTIEKATNKNELLRTEPVPGTNNSSMKGDYDAQEDRAAVPLAKEPLIALGLSADEMLLARAVESKLQLEDSNVERTLSVKNELEASIYTTRSELSEKLCDYATADEKRIIMEKTEVLEDWLYNDGDSETLERYVHELDGLKLALSPVKERFDAYNAARSSLTELSLELGRIASALRAAESKQDGPNNTNVSEAYSLMKSTLASSEDLAHQAKADLQDEDGVPRSTLPIFSSGKLLDLKASLLSTESSWLSALKEAARTSVGETASEDTIQAKYVAPEGALDEAGNPSVEDINATDDAQEIEQET